MRNLTRTRASLWLLVLVAAPLATSLHAQRPLIGNGVKHARATIEAVGSAPGQATLLVTLQVDPGWHVSWRNPGETGLPTRLSFSLPAGVVATGETWPVPVIAHTPVGATHTLEGTVPWLVQLRVDSASTVDRLIGLTLRYGICRDVCIPEQLSVQGVLPGASGTRAAVVPATLRVRLAAHGGVVAARRRSPTELCLDRLPLAAGTPLPEIVADSGLGIDAAQPIRRARGSGHGFLMNVLAGAALRTGDRLLVVQGAKGVEVRVDLARAAPACR